jgi:hypothetical protein
VDALGARTSFYPKYLPKKKAASYETASSRKESVSLLVVFDRQSVDHQTKTDFVNGVGKVVEQVQ